MSSFALVPDFASNGATGLEGRAITPPAPLNTGKYRCIVVDPPWDQGKTGKRSCRPNQTTKLDYPTMTPQEILSLPVPEWASNSSYLWLWATNSRSRSTDRPIISVALEAMEYWGFRYYTMLTWDKRTGPCPFGPYQITTEYVLFGYRGKAQFPRKSLGQAKTMFSESSRGHSVKPSSLYAHISKHFPGPRLDVFARRAHDGFEGWGNEYERHNKDLGNSH